MKPRRGAPRAPGRALRLGLAIVKASTSLSGGEQRTLVVVLALFILGLATRYLR